jgi:hypothetical protein
MNCDAYTAGRGAALATLGVVKTSATMIGMRARKDPFSEISRRLQQAFVVKTPKFDVSAHLSRMMKNPFKQPSDLLAGKLQPLKA